MRARNNNNNNNNLKKLSFKEIKEFFLKNVFWKQLTPIDSLSRWLDYLR